MTCPAASAAHLPISPEGFTIDAAPPGNLRAELVGRTLLYWWPADGWQRGTITRLCPCGTFSHMVAHTRDQAVIGAARHCLHIL